MTTIPSSQRRPAHFVERNLYLAALLGLASKGGRLARWITEESMSSAEQPACGIPAESMFISFLLGVVSVERFLAQTARECALEADKSEEPGATTGEPCLRTLLT
jgi:hypothetical protein